MSISVSAAFPDLLRSRLAGICELDAQQVARLEAHYRLLLRWNKVLNLTAVRSLEEIVERHYCEALFLAAHLPPGPGSVGDIGSGAGFPGFPVAVLRPELAVTLIESHQRKAVFLREASRGLTNVSVVGKRAEEVAVRFDWVVSRAVKYEDIAGTLPRLAPKAALLVGDVEPADLPGYEWADPVPLPWGRRRYLFVSK